MITEDEILLDGDGLAKASGILTVFNYAPATGLYTGSTQEYLAHGVGIPAYSTTHAPPDNIQGKVSIFQDGNWLQVADHRGETVYLKTTGEAITVTSPGEYPSGTTLMKPETQFDKWGGERWITDKAAQLQALTDEAQNKRICVLLRPRVLHSHGRRSCYWTLFVLAQT
ncbi:tail fiber assembly protein [Erwinia tracheiphila]|uniref:Tail fiber assembly protein n=1 Tax=Erwinia tracheiphila TaxID=65700 RepID=A0A345CWA9_9GAMM|nr:tail fiber assembly protein [Erwinia tracheiphila]AXF77726.1 tail fiber assembly protein [Erwinia tracheiphila]UIA83589.1 tail fiber assembly protein [Erwinia tracheiphila]UIA92173.1 tail fiber assembly protein [Erwinia tracheiphila]